MSGAIGLVLARDGAPLPDPVGAWLRTSDLAVAVLRTPDALLARCLRGRPRIAIIDAREHLAWGIAACERLKADSYTGVIPAVLLCDPGRGDVGAAFRSGADEVLLIGMEPQEFLARLDLTLRRSDRDVGVHPSTRLPGAVAIEAELARRLSEPTPFAMCYADIDHFKEYNDRYSYSEGDRVIRVLARVLHDVVKGLCGEQGFVGHIGGDDFVFIIPASAIAETCSEIIAVFDAIVPYQYSEADRRAGYFFGKDRRGQLHRVPLMTVSVGVVTNERRHFTTPSQVSELASEMKSYAKTLPGSVYSVDRRHDVRTTTGAPLAFGGAPSRQTEDR